MSCCKRVSQSVGDCMRFLWTGIDERAIQRITDQALEDLKKLETTEERRVCLNKWVIAVYEENGFYPQIKSLEYGDRVSLETEHQMFDPIIRKELATTFSQFSEARDLLREARNRVVFSAAYQPTELKYD